MVRRMISMLLLAAVALVAAPVSYQEVPEHWKPPLGPYHQAPGECGARWYAVSPFNQTPWKLECGAAPVGEPVTPAGFVEIFGARPDPNDFRDTPNPALYYRIATDRWNQDLGFFKKAGAPEWITPVQRSESDATFKAWGMGAPKYYEGRYGPFARFTESAIKDFEAPAWSMVFATHNLVASYQMRMIELGEVPPKRHPFVPPHLWPQGLESFEEQPVP